MIVTTKLGQAEHMGKHEPSVAIVRLARELRDFIEEQGQMSSEDVTAYDNVLHEFIATLPRKAQEEVLHG